MNAWPDLLPLAGTILVAAVLGALVGTERERGEHAAGLRTHILVCVGAALFTLVSRDLAGTRFDPGRIAAQIVSGIGFLGAGTILRQGPLIRGLTTAASLWVVAGIGMAVAVGGAMAWLAAFTTVLVVFTLTFMNRLEVARLMRSRRQTLLMGMSGDREALGQMLIELAERGIELHRMNIDSESAGSRLEVRLELRLPGGVTPQSLGPWLGGQPGVSRFDWE